MNKFTHGLDLSHEKGPEVYQRRDVHGHRAMEGKWYITKEVLRPKPPFIQHFQILAKEVSKR